MPKVAGSSGGWSGSARSDAGYAVVAGERFRLRTGPAVRVTSAQLRRDEVEPVADALAEAARGRSLIS